MRRRYVLIHIESGPRHQDERGFRKVYQLSQPEAEVFQSLQGIKRIYINIYKSDSNASSVEVSGCLPELSGRHD